MASTMNSKSRVFWAVLSVITIFTVVLLFLSMRLPMSPTERVIYTRAALASARNDIKQFRDSFGRYPHTLKEAVRNARGLDDDALSEDPWREYLTEARGNSIEHQVLNGQGGWYYNEATGKLKVNLNGPVRQYLARHPADGADEIPSDW